MKIFPAIDIKDKKCVRLVKGDFDNKTEYEMSPIEQAGKFKDHGFKNLHIVDLDGALTGVTVNLDIIKDIIGKFNLNIEEGFYFKEIKKINFKGPFLIENKLTLFSSNGYLKIIDPLNGKLLKSINFDFLATEPIFIEDKLIILTSDGDLKVYK